MERIMDINPFELAGKTVRRAYETVEDAYYLSQEVIADTIPYKLVLGDPGWAREHSEGIIDSAYKALNHNDIDEVAHQFHRELYFSSIVDKLAGSPNEAAAKSGLEAVERKEPASAIDKAVKEAWTKTLYSR